MNTKKNKKILFSLLLFFFVLENVYAFSVSFEGKTATGERSDDCGGRYCATDKTGSGFRIAIVDENGSQVSRTRVLNFWPNTNYKSYSSGYCPYNTSTSFHFVGSGHNGDVSPANGADYDIGLNGGMNSSNLAEMYSDYFSNKLADNARKIVEALDISSGIDYFSEENSKKYFLRFEPIYVITEYSLGSCIYLRGTSREIIGAWKGHCDDSFNGSGISSSGTSYITGAGGDDNAYCTMIYGDWNVTRNYLVGINTPCQDDSPTAKPLFKYANGYCFSSTRFGATLASTYNYDLTDLNNTYTSGRGHGIGVGYVSFSDIGGPPPPPKYKLTIKKVRSGGALGNTAPITGKNFVFKLFNSLSDCNNKINAIPGGPANQGNGTFTFSDLENGTYYYLETAAPSGYEIEDAYKDTCKSVTIAGADVVVTVPNKPSCAVEFDTKKAASGSVSMDDRIKLYNYYKNAGNDFRNLLNYDNTQTGEVACSKLENLKITTTPECLKPTNPAALTKIEYKIGANTYSVGPSAFNANNVSFYNEIVKDINGNDVGYCLAYISRMESGLPVLLTGSPKAFRANKGKMLIKNENGVAGLLYLTKVCYVYGTSNSNLIDATYNNKFKDYVTAESLKFTSKVSGVNTVYDTISSLASSDNPTFKYSAKSDYGSCLATESCKLKNTKMEIIKTFALKSNFSLTGPGTLKYVDSKITSTQNVEKPTGYDVSEYNFLGFGFATKYTEENDSGNLVFSISHSLANTEVINGACPYVLTSNEYPEFEFRVVDSRFPFAGKNYIPGSSRDTGKNWKSKSINSVSVRNYCRDLISPLGTGYYKPGDDDYDDDCDLNDDYFLDSRDLEILEYAISIGVYAGTDSGNNYLVRYVMDNRNDSMDKTGSGPKYVITLTSGDIQKIREYNSSHSYDDFATDVKCKNDSKDCVSEFFEKIKSATLPGGGTLTSRLEVLIP